MGVITHPNEPVGRESIMDSTYAELLRQVHECNIMQCAIRAYDDTFSVNDLPRPSPTRAVKSYAITFHVLKDMDFGSKSLSDLYPRPRELAATLLEAAALVSGRKRLAHKNAMTATANKYPKPELTLLCEEILARRDDNNDTSSDTRRIAGFRLRVIFDVAADRLHAYAREQKKKKKKNPQSRSRRNNNEAATAPSIIDDEAEEEEEPEPETTPVNDDDESDPVATWCPLSDGIKWLFADRAVLDARMAKTKKQYLRYRGPPNEAPLVVRHGHAPISDVAIYAWLRTSNPMDLHVNSILPFIQASNASDDPRLVDWKDIEKSSGATDFYATAKSCRPSYIFDNATAFSYHADLIDPAQCDPAAYGYPSFDLIEEEDNDEEEILSDLRVDGDDDDNSIRHSPRNTATNHGAGTGARVRAFVESNITSPNKWLTAPPSKFPFGSLVHRVPYVLPEILMQVDFRFAVGQEITQQEVENGHCVSLSAISRWATAIARLERARDAQASFVAELPEPLTPEEAQRIVSRQGDEMKMLMITEMARAATGEYKDLFEPPPNPAPPSLTAAFGREQHTTASIKERSIQMAINGIHYAPGTDDTTANTRGRATPGYGTAVLLDKTEHARQVATVGPAGHHYVDNTSAEIQFVSSKIDATRAVFVERDDILALRSKNQAKFAIMKYRFQEAMRTVSTPDEKKTRKKEYADYFYTETLRSITETITTLRESNNIATSLMSSEFRGYYLDKCTEAGYSALVGTDESTSFVADVKPFQYYVQWIYDFIVGVRRATPQSLKSIMVKFYGPVLDAHTYVFNRRNPAINVIAYANAGTGKSFGSEVGIEMTPPGVTLRLSTVSPSVFTTDTSFDNYLIYFDEMKISWVKMNKEARDMGGSNEMNVLKDRQTTFEANAARGWYDEKTGKTQSVQTSSSHHNAMMGQMNQTIEDVDTGVLRRNIFFNVPKHKLLHTTVPMHFDDFGSSEYSSALKQARDRVVMVTALYITLRTLIKSAAIVPVNTTSLQIWAMMLMDRLRQRGITVTDTNMHFIKQMAENYQLHYAAWMGLFSPIARAYFDVPTNPRPWTPQAILDLCVPHMVVGKDAFIMAATTLDHLIEPRHMSQMITDIARDGLHVDDSRRHRFRYFPPTPSSSRNNNNNDGHSDTGDYDVDYLVMSDPTMKGLLHTISRYNPLFELREQDISSMLSELSNQRFVCHPYVVRSAHPGSGVPERIELDRTTGKVPRPVVIIEVDPTARNKTQGRRLCVLIAYLVDRLGIDFIDPDCDRQALRKILAANNVPPPTPRDTVLDEHFLDRHLRCARDFSVVSDVLQDMFSNRILEKHDAEAPGHVPSSIITQYATGYLLDPLNVIYPAADGHTETVHVHGTPKFLACSRNSSAAYSVLKNEGMLLATASRSIIGRKRARDDGSNVIEPASCTGTIIDRYDPDYSAVKRHYHDMQIRPLTLNWSEIGTQLKHLKIGFAPFAYQVTQFLPRVRQQVAEGNVLDYPRVNVVQCVKEMENLLILRYNPRALMNTTSVPDFDDFGSCSSADDDAMDVDDE